MQTLPLYTPSVSIIMPFETKVSEVRELTCRLDLAVKKVADELLAQYPEKRVSPILDKLKHLVINLDYHSQKQSIALYVSPLVEKVFYLNFTATEKIVVDQSFEIRDLIYSKKRNLQFLVLLLSDHSSSLYLGNCSERMLLKMDFPQKVQHESLYHTDLELSDFLKQYHLPVYVIAAKSIIGDYKKVTRNAGHIIQYIPGNYIEAGENDIRMLVEPYTSVLSKMRELNILYELERAADTHKLSFGISGIRAAINERKGRLLLVEKDYMQPAKQDLYVNHIKRNDLTLNNPSYVKDAVEDAMEKVLAIGGDVEFVDNGVLKDYGHVALINHY